MIKALILSALFASVSAAAVETYSAGVMLENRAEDNCRMLARMSMRQSVFSETMAYKPPKVTGVIGKDGKKIAVVYLYKSGGSFGCMFKPKDTGLVQLVGFGNTGNHDQQMTSVNTLY